MIGIYLLAAAPFMAGGAGLALAVSGSTATSAASTPRISVARPAAAFCSFRCSTRSARLARCCSRRDWERSRALLFAVPGGRLGRGATWVPAAGAVAALALQFWHPWLDVYGAKGHEDAPLLFSKWNSFSRIAVYDRPHPDWGLSDTYQGPLPVSHYMDIDAAASTPILEGSGGVPRSAISAMS